MNGYLNKPRTIKELAQKLKDKKIANMELNSDKELALSFTDGSKLFIYSENGLLYAIFNEQKPILDWCI